MTDFLDALVDKKLSKIILSGYPSAEELNDAWVFFLVEYHEQRGDTPNTLEPIRLKREISRAKHHLYLLDVCVEFLKNHWSESIAQSVRVMGYNFSPSSNIPEEYTNELDSVVQQSKTKYIELRQNIKLLQDEMDKIQDVKPSREGFEHNLLEFEQMQRTSYSFDTLTVSKYLTLEKKYTRYANAINARSEKT